MVSVTRKWHSSHDKRVCGICEHLDNWEFTVEAVNGKLPESIMHPVYGEVWNTAIGSLAHEHYQYGKKYGLLSKCRCHIEVVQVSAPELLALVKKLRDEIQMALADKTDDTKGGEHRSTSFEDIGVDPSKYGF